MKIKVYPIKLDKENAFEVDIEDMLDDGFGNVCTEFDVDFDGIVRQSEIVRPGKTQDGVIGISAEYAYLYEGEESEDA